MYISAIISVERKESGGVGDFQAFLCFKTTLFFSLFGCPEQKVCDLLCVQDIKLCDLLRVDSDCTFVHLLILRNCSLNAGGKSVCTT